MKRNRSNDDQSREKRKSELIDATVTKKRFSLGQALDWVISSEQELNEPSLQLTEPSPVYDGIDTIPRLQKQEFIFTCPYRIGADKIYTARPSLADNHLTRKLTVARPKGVAVMNYTERFICSLLGEDVRVRIDNDSVVIGIYAGIKPALDGKDPLNTFRVHGVIYKDNRSF